VHVASQVGAVGSACVVDGCAGDSRSVGETLLPAWQHGSDVRVGRCTELVLICNDNVTGRMGRRGEHRVWVWGPQRRVFDS
jgi:hypothetical protein